MAASTDGLLLSGQLVLDRSAGVADAHRFLCADLLALGGKAVAAQPLHKQLALLGAEVLEPRATWRRHVGRGAARPPA